MSKGMLPAVVEGDARDGQAVRACGFDVQALQRLLGIRVLKGVDPVPAWCGVGSLRGARLKIAPLISIRGAAEVQWDMLLMGPSGKGGLAPGARRLIDLEAATDRLSVLRAILVRVHVVGQMLARARDESHLYIEPFPIGGGIAEVSDDDEGCST